MLSAKNGKAFREFYDTVRDESALDRKTTILIGLAAALTSGCGP
jgi:hypothetical protein